MNLDNENNWVLLRTCQTLQEAQLLKSVLNENEIMAVILNKQDSSYLFGEHELFIASENLQLAEKIINDPLI